MQNTAWQLETPDGRMFTALRIRGNHQQTKKLLQEFGSREGRSLGEIVNSDTFIINGCDRFPLTMCKYFKIVD